MAARSLKRRIEDHIRTWEARGYSGGIPDEVPEGLSRDCLAPSYKAICLAILNNDVALKSLGHTPRRSRWYDALKQIELGPDCKKPTRRRTVDLRQLDWVDGGQECL